MISYRQADLIDRIKPHITFMGGWFFTDSNGSSKYYLFYTDEKTSPLEEKLNRLILGYDDMEKTAISREHTPRGSGFKSQFYEDRYSAVENLKEFIRGIKDIDGVKDAEFIGSLSAFTIRIISL